MRGIKVTFKDGKHDWFDPCDEIIIDNGEHQYKIKVDDILSLETYEVGENPIQYTIQAVNAQKFCNFIEKHGIPGFNK